MSKALSEGTFLCTGKLHTPLSQTTYLLCPKCEHHCPQISVLQRTIQEYRAQEVPVLFVLWKRLIMHIPEYTGYMIGFSVFPAPVLCYSVCWLIIGSDNTPQNVHQSATTLTPPGSAVADWCMQQCPNKNKEEGDC